MVVFSLKNVVLEEPAASETSRKEVQTKVKAKLAHYAAFGNILGQPSLKISSNTSLIGPCVFSKEDPFQSKQLEHVLF